MGEPRRGDAVHPPVLIYRIALTAAELNLIGQALGRLPFDDVAPLIVKIRVQASTQEVAFNEREDDAPSRKHEVTQPDRPREQEGRQGNRRAEAR